MSWREGLSKTSIGRFGGYDEDYNISEKGFLCFNATADRISIEDRMKTILGMFRLKKNFLVDISSVDWTTIIYNLKYEQNGTLVNKTTVYQSLLSPGILFDIEDNCFYWLSERSYQLMVYSYPLKKGVVTRKSNALYDINIDGKLTAPWILAFSNCSGIPDIPLLFIFQNQPVKIIAINDDYKKYVFNKKAGRVIVMPVLGIDRLTNEEVRLWRKELPSKIINKCNFWSRIMQTYPVKCKEEYFVDEKKRTVRIQNKFEYIAGENDWGIKPVYIAPVSPVVYHAKKYGYPVKFNKKIVDINYPTRFGYYTFAYSNSVQYEIPLFEHTNETILPVKISNDPQFDILNKKLNVYLTHPTLTFGGDNTYNEMNIQDVLHNYRILSWATWSLDEQTRKRILKKMAFGLKNMVKENYVQEIEPVSKRSYLREKEIWAIVGGKVTYDYEWYNGMQLAGLWAYTFFDNDSNSKKFITEKWDIIIGLSNYYRIFNDWVTGTFWTDTTGEFLWMDGFHYGWQGLIGLVRLSKQIGNKQIELETEYMLAKSTLARWCTFFLQEYVSKHQYSYNQENELSPDKIMNEHIVGGFIARKGLVLCKYHNQGNVISYFVPELFLLYNDYPEIMDKLHYGQYKLLPQDCPDWNTNFTKYIEQGLNDQSLRKENNQDLAWAHFYFLDSHLFIRALLFREPLTKLMSYTDSLTGPVIESYLVGTHPVVIFPTDIKFCGNEWDEKTKTLTIKFESEIKKEMIMKILTDKKPKIIPENISYEYNKKTKLLKCRFITEKKVNEMKFVF